MSASNIKTHCMKNESSESVTPEHSPDVARANAARQERAVGLCLLIDVITFIPCAAVAVLSGSMLLLSDVMDYAKSFIANGVALRILRGIRKGHTHDYDYGAGKVEQLGGLFGSLCFVAGLLALGGYSFYRLLNPIELHMGFTAMGIAIQVAGFAINSWLWWRTKQLAIQTNAPLIEVQWRHKRADALSNLAVLAALSLTIVFRSRSWEIYIDPLCALAYVFYVTASYVPIIRNALRDLMDHTLEEDLQLKIVRRLAEHYAGYEAFNGVRSRRAGSRIFIDINLSFDPDKRIGEALDTINSLRAGVEADIPSSEVSISLKPMERFNLSSEEKTSIQILPLSPATLEPAVALIMKTFTIRPNEMPREELEESLWPGKHTEALAKIGISDPRYWVAFYKHQVVGVAGLAYRPEDRHEAIWGGWTVYADEGREGLSRARYLMLKKIAIEASATGRKFFRLDTTTDLVSKHANRFYDRIGLTVYKTEDHGPGQPTVLYRQMEMEKVMPYFSREKKPGKGVSPIEGRSTAPQSN